MKTNTLTVPVEQRLTCSADRQRVSVPADGSFVFLKYGLLTIAPAQDLAGRAQKGHGGEGEDQPRETADPHGTALPPWFTGALWIRTVNWRVCSPLLAAD